MGWYSDLRQKMADAEIGLLLKLNVPAFVYGIYGKYAINPLIEAFGESAIIVLGNLSSKITIPGIVDLLINILSDGNERSTRCAVEALGKIGKDAIGPLAKILRGTEDKGTDFSNDVPVFLDLLTDSSKSLRLKAATDLENAAKKGDRKTKTAIIFGIRTWMRSNWFLQEREKNSTVYVDVVRCYAEIGNTLKNADDKDKNLRLSAAAALVKIGKDSVNVLIDALGDSNEQVRKNATNALEEIGDERGLKFARIIVEKSVNYALKLGLEETRKVLSEFVKIIEKDRDLAKTNRTKLELAEFYNVVAVSIAKKGKGISVEGGELLKATVKPPNGQDRMYDLKKASMPKIRVQ